MSAKSAWALHADAKRPSEDGKQGGTPKKPTPMSKQAKDSLATLRANTDALKQRERSWQRASQQSSLEVVEAGNRRLAAQEAARAAKAEATKTAREHERLSREEERAKQNADRATRNHLLMTAYNAAHDQILQLAQQLIEGTVDQNTGFVGREFVMEAAEWFVYPNQEGGSVRTEIQQLPVRAVAASVELTAKPPSTSGGDLTDDGSFEDFDETDLDPDNDDDESILPPGLELPVLSVTFEALLGQNTDGTFTEAQLEKYKGNGVDSPNVTERWPVVPQREGARPVEYSSRLEKQPDVYFVGGPNNILKGDRIRFTTTYQPSQAVFGGVPESEPNEQILSLALAFVVDASSTASSAGKQRTSFESVLLSLQ